MITDFNTGADVVTPDEIKSYLSAKQKLGVLTAADIFKDVKAWVTESKLQDAIPSAVIEQYAMCAGRWIQCEEAISQFGFLAKHPTTGAAIASPYVAMAQSYLKQATAIWELIEEIARDNADKIVKTSPEDDKLDRLVSGGR